MFRSALLLSFVLLPTIAHSEELLSSPRVDFGIVVADVEKAIEFYEQVGFSEQSSFDVGAEMGRKAGLSDSHAFTVHVLQGGEGEDATRVKIMSFPQAEPQRQDLRYIHSTRGISYLTVYVNDVDASLKKLEELKVKPLAEGPVDLGNGKFLVLIRDPDGNIVELVGPRGER